MGNGCGARGFAFEELHAPRQLSTTPALPETSGGDFDRPIPNSGRFRRSGFNRTSQHSELVAVRDGSSSTGTTLAGSTEDEVVGMAGASA